MALAGYIDSTDAFQTFRPDEENNFIARTSGKYSMR